MILFNSAAESIYARHAEMLYKDRAAELFAAGGWEELVTELRDQAVCRAAASGLMRHLLSGERLWSDWAPPCSLRTTKKRLSFC